MDSLIASYQAGCKEDTDAIREVQRMVEDTLAAAGQRETDVQRIIKCRWWCLASCVCVEYARFAAHRPDLAACSVCNCRRQSALPYPCRAPQASTDAPAKPNPPAAALTTKIGQLEVQADYTEARAAHDREVAQLNDSIKTEQAALTQLTEDTR